ncbi:hypothetical protein IO99_12940 [Clostridium sulfidigenes]|uniref:Uncharacterized protein n=1 Tax=Clostridium sulfidigenes TaxID=318464 RepID=A0A084J9S1_9CLOT|nr:hypothetical protein [Clostridium sulfidigenes]KEZ85705.1 hypothetical protein IO99_12940 [Clostridium sulfidigenes]
MTKEYKVNYSEKKRIKRKQIRNHPKWDKRKWVRYILIVIVIAALIILPSLPWTATDFIFDGKNIEEIKANTLYNICSASVGIVIMFIGMPVFIYFRSLKNTCADSINYYLNETLILSDGGLEYGFVPNNSSTNQYTLDRIQYRGIKRLVVNTYHERLEIYGDMKLTVYSNYEENQILYIENHKDDKRRFYLYYENSEDLIRTLEEKTGIKVQVINKQEE